MGVSKILDFLSFPDPTFAILLVCFLRIHTGQHAIVKQGIRLPEIDNIELDLFINGQILYPEVKPLGISFCVDIILKEQVVLEDAYL